MKQQVLPIFNFDGKVIMEEPNKLLLAPNGNGAIYDAINNNQDAKEIINSIDYIQIVTVDNVLNKILDPFMLGYTARKDLYLSMKAIEVKRD